MSAVLCGRHKALLDQVNSNFFLALRIIQETHCAHYIKLHMNKTQIKSLSNNKRKRTIKIVM